MKRSAHSARYIFRARALLLTLVRGTQESPVIFACYEARLHSGVAKTPAQAPMSHAAGDPSGPKAIRTSAFDSSERHSREVPCQGVRPGKCSRRRAQAAASLSAASCVGTVSVDGGGLLERALTPMLVPPPTSKSPRFGPRLRDLDEDARL